MEINKLLGKTQQKGLTLIPLRIYFSKRGYAKVELGLAKGKSSMTAVNRSKPVKPAGKCSGPSKKENRSSA